MSSFLNLRSADTNVYLIGKCEKNIVGGKLPSKLQVLQCFFYYVRCEKKTVKESGKLALKNILPFWERARLPMLHERSCVEKLLKLYDEWRTVQKVCKSSFPSYRKKENDFKENLNNLFDIAHIDALEMISIQEDRDFLIKQREQGRVGSMASIDQCLASKEKRKAQRKEKEIQRKEKYQRRESTQDLTVECDVSVESECVGSGAAIAQSIYNYLEEMNMINSLEMVCFDTTATNTGQHNGAGMLLERKLERSLLWLPCRHHIAEILLRTAFEIYFGKSSGPEVVLFERFSREWNTFNMKDFNIGIMDEEVQRAITVEEIKASKEFCIQNLAKDYIRHDYKELLQLTFIFLGGSIPNFSFRAPGATSHARFMSKAIYALKIFALNQQFKISSSQLNGFRNVCIFLVRLYVPYWFRSNIAVEAPNRDLQLIKNIAGCLDSKISLPLLNKMRNHLWYLSEEAVALAFFDSNVDLNVKKSMVAALGLDNEIESDEDNSVSLFKKLCASLEDMKEFTSKDLSCFVTKRTKNFFTRLEIDVDFLNFEPSTWCERAEYLKGVQILKNITVVNDSAERKVKLITDFNRSLTHSEQDKQYLLHIVENYRHEFPSYTKSSLL